MADATKTFRALHRFAAIAPRKAHLVACMVRGMPVNDALAALEHSPKRGAFFLRKVLKSALANAGNDLDVDLNSLVVSDARADMGPLLGGRVRWMPRAMGRATPIHKRTSHILVELKEQETKRKRGARGAPEAAAESGGTEEATE
ncbi:MAG: 50S ribosomal protein L22 [Planctomycetaceae bacterium]